MKTGTRRTFLIRAGRLTMGLGLLPALATVVSGCRTMEKVTKIGTDFAASEGLISGSQADSIIRSSAAVAKTFTDITPEQEYYIGRAVGATILENYRPYESAAPNRYVNLLGQALARASDGPRTFSGYHFQILDSDDINALSAPGGLIFVTRGLLKCCGNEDAAAAVLAHEIAHVQLKHGLQAIKKARLTSALTTIGQESAKTFGGRQLAELTGTFGDAIADITQTLINSGYSRKFEYQADQTAATMMTRVGYDPNGLVELLAAMDRRLKPGARGFSKTHPEPRQRIAELQRIIGPVQNVTAPAGRQARFDAAIGAI